MKREDVCFNELPETPGVYVFRGPRNTVLYVGRATDIRSRVRSYFSDRLLVHRGPRMVDGITKAKRIEALPTDSVLEAYILEAHLIKKYEPAYNVVDKDNKSFQFVGITREAFPRVLVVRGRDLEQGTVPYTLSHIFGPFPRGSMLKEALKVLRRILPYRDTCTPYDPKRAPGKKYAAVSGVRSDCARGSAPDLWIRKPTQSVSGEIVLFLRGRKKQLVTLLEREMKQLAKQRKFEEAEAVRKRVFALTHIQDISLIRDDVVMAKESGSFRIEAYDVAHLQGTDTVGVFVVFVDGEKVPAEYRTFSIRSAKPGDDTGALHELLDRRLRHTEWEFPNLIVLDGAKAHLSVAERVFAEYGVQIPVVSVVKTERHTPRNILGNQRYARMHERSIIAANTEAHRFAVARHRRKRSRGMMT